ncbi:hypothetical protein [Streptomyces rectiverticillatus]|uniref:hypothetical protein n=1 Tax=Streptomyces rectiverticillatus TaxID=173860 RepID=UPI0015C31F8F|nr:hypothetical protein [Streptomyces rectiverticillatus]
MTVTREVVLELECDTDGVGSATVTCSPNGTLISTKGAGLKAASVRELEKVPNKG